LGVFSLFFSQNQPKLHPSLGQNRAWEPKFPPSSSSFLHPTEVGRRSSHLRPNTAAAPVVFCSIFSQSHRANTATATPQRPQTHGLHRQPQRCFLQPAAAQTRHEPIRQ
jgi:hypothetical protein